MMKHLGKIKKASGFYMVTALIILSAGVSLYLSLLYKKQQDFADIEKARLAGTQMRAFASGVIRFISDNAGTIASGTAPSSTAWLKSNTCGGTIAGDGFLPCTFPDVTPYRDSYTTVFTVTGGVVEANISIPWPLINGVRHGALGAVVARAAGVDMGPFAADVAPIDPAMLGWLTVLEPIDTMAASNTQIVVSTNVSRDIFLRTDGANAMDADLDMNSNDIVNVIDITGTGLISTADLTATGAIEGLTGTFTSTALAIEASGDIEADGDITSLGNIRGASVESLGNMATGDPTTTASTSFTFRQNASSSEHVVLEAETTSSGTQTFNDLRVRSGDGGMDVDFVANNVYSEDINRYMSQAVFNMTVAKVGDFIPFPPCPTGMSEQIFTAVDAISFGIADPIEKFDIIPLRQAAGWLLDAELVTTNYGVINGSDVKADITVTTKCM
jgi:hypothetical protein